MAASRRTASLASLIGSLSLGVVAGDAAVADAAPPPPVYRYTIRLADADSPTATVVFSEVDASGATRLTPAGRPTPIRLCLEMMRTGRFVGRPRLLPPSGAPIPLAQSADDPECFEARAPAGTRVEVTYTVALGAMAAAQGNLDSASEVPGGYVLSDKALLMRPEPTPDEGTVELEVVPGPWAPRLATPWEPVDERAGRYRMSIDALDGGGYLALGLLKRLPALTVPGGAVEVVRFESPHKTPDEALSSWVREAATMLADFHGGATHPRMLVLLAGVPGNEEGSVFGTVMKRSPVPSVVLLYGRDSPATAFEGDWMAPHEIFHVGNPAIRGRFPWFIEGFTTYYQDVVRARARPDRAAAMWADLVEQFGRHCNGERPLLEESRRLYELHNWTRVYWGGACLAFEADVAIRARTRNKESLDTVMRALLAESRREPLDEETVLLRLDRAAGGKRVSGRLRGTAKADLASLYRQLGIEPQGGGGRVVVLRDDAPMASVRRAIFAPAAAPSTGL